MEKQLFLILAYAILWFAMGFKRVGVSRIDLFSKDWWIQFCLVAIATQIIINIYKN